MIPSPQVCVDSLGLDPGTEGFHILNYINEGGEVPNVVYTTIIPRVMAYGSNDAGRGDERNLPSALVFRVGVSPTAGIMALECLDTETGLAQRHARPGHRVGTAVILAWHKDTGHVILPRTTRVTVGGRRGTVAGATDPETGRVPVRVDDDALSDVHLSDLFIDITA